MPWQPGETGNIRGRPKLSGMVRGRLRELSSKALDKLEHIMEYGEETNALNASKFILGVHLAVASNDLHDMVVEPTQDDVAAALKTLGRQPQLVASQEEDAIERAG